MVEYIRWSNEEEGLSYIGVLTKESDTSVHLLTKFGEFEIQRTDGKFEESTREEFDESVVPVKEQEVVVQVKSGSKMEICVEIFNRMNGQERKDIIKEMMKVLDISKPHASTYYQTIKSKQK